NSQRQLPTDHDYAVPTREYQTDQSSLKPAQAAARSVFGKKQKQRQKQPHRSSEVDTVTPYQGKSLIVRVPGGWSAIGKLRAQQAKLWQGSHLPMICPSPRSLASKYT